MNTARLVALRDHRPRHPHKGWWETAATMAAKCARHSCPMGGAGFRTVAVPHLACNSERQMRCSEMRGCSESVQDRDSKSRVLCTCGFDPHHPYNARPRRLLTGSPVVATLAEDLGTPPERGWRKRHGKRAAFGPPRHLKHSRIVGIPCVSHKPEPGKRCGRHINTSQSGTENSRAASTAGSMTNSPKELMVPSLTDTHCVNGHDLAVVGLYPVRGGKSHFCKKCHHSSLARARARLAAIRDFPCQLVTDREFRNFWRKVDKSAPGGCWVWTAATFVSNPPQPHEYGVVQVACRRQLAHRVSYAIVHGEIPEGAVLDHLCRNTVCVNPGHLEAVTQAENIARGVAPVGKHGDRNYQRLIKN